MNRNFRNKLGKALALIVSITLISSSAMQSKSPTLGTGTTAYAFDAQPVEILEVDSERLVDQAQATPISISSDEKVDMRSEFGRVFKTDSGYRVELHTQPIHYEIGPGTFEPIDNSVVPSVRDGYRFENKANSWKALFTNQPGQNRMRVEWKNLWFTLGLDETGMGSDQLQARASGNSVIYEAPGAPQSIHYDVQTGSVKERIVLERFSGRHQWTSRLQVSGLVARTTEDGSIALAPDYSVMEPAWTIDPVIAVDAAGETHRGSLDLQKLGNDMYLVKASVDKTWLSAPDRAYPVTVDPSVTIVSTTGGRTLQYTGDSGSYGMLLESPYNGDERRGLIKAALNQFSEGFLATNQLQSAILRLRATSPTWCWVPTGSCNSTTLFAELLAQDWDQNVSKWSRPRWVGTSWDGGDACTTEKCPGLPASAMQVQGQVNLSVGSWNDIDLTAPVQRMLENSHPMYGLLLRLESPPDGKATLNALDVNAGVSPTFIFTFQSDSVPPTALIQSPLDGSTVSPGMLAVSMNVADQVDDGVAGAPSRVELYLDNRRVSTQLIDAGGTYNFSVATGPLSPGTHQVFARVYDRAGNTSDSAPISVNYAGSPVSAPDNLVVTPGANNQQQLSWSPATKLASSGTGSTSISYEVHRSSSSTFDSYSVVQTGWTTTSLTDAPGPGTWFYRVKAVNDHDQQSALSMAVSTQPPYPAHSLDTRALANGRVLVTWQPSPNFYWDPGITYTVYRMPSGGTPSVVATSVTGTSWVDDNATVGMSYEYAVAAVDLAGGQSAPTEYMAGTPMAYSAPDAPDEITAASGVLGQASVSWTASSDPEVTYDLYRSVDQSQWNLIASDLATANQTDTGLTEGVYYYYRVQSEKNGVAGPFSASAGAMAVKGHRLGVDSRWPYTSVATAEGIGVVNLNNGNFSVAVTDSVIPAPYLPVVIRRTYNSQSNFTGAMGLGWRLNAEVEIEDLGSQVVLRLGDGSEHVYAKDGAAFVPPPRFYWTLEKPADTFVVSRPDRIQYQFDLNNRLSQIMERNGNSITYSYDGAGRVQSIVDPVGRVTTLSYDAAGSLTGITDGAGRSWQYVYQDGRLTAVTDPSGRTATYGYDQAGQLVFAADPSQRWTAYAYDSSGRLVTITDGAGNQTHLQFATGASGIAADLIDPLGGRTTFVSDLNGYLTRLTDAVQNEAPTPKSWTYEYTFSGVTPSLLLSSRTTAPNGVTTDLTFDSRGNVTQLVEQGTDLTASGVSTRTQSVSYLPDSSDMTTIVDPEGNSTTWTYDASNSFRLISVTDGAQGVTSFTYSTDPVQKGWVSVVTDPRGNETEYSYDNLGNVTRTANPLSPSKTVARDMTYAADGSLQTITEMGDIGSIPSALTRFDYDQLGRKVRAVYPDGSQEAWAYDASGQLALHVDALGVVERNLYDATKRLVSYTDGRGKKQYQYDSLGNTTAIVDARGGTMSTSYDAAGRPTRTVTPAGMTTKLAYDEMGNVLSSATGHQTVVDTAPYSITATYYPTGLLQSIAEPLPGDSVLYPDGSTPTDPTVYNVESYEYNRDGKVTRVTDGNGNSTHYSYDQVYRLTQVTDAMGNLTEYAYDANGNQTHSWDAAHPQASGAAGWLNQYDALNRLVSVTDPIGNSTAMVYDDAGDMVQKTEPRSNGPASVWYTYDLGHRPISVQYENKTGLGPFSTALHRYAAGGLRVFSRDDWGSAWYDYDVNGRQISAQGPWENSSRTYDANDNPTSVTYSLGAVAYTYDSNNRMISIEDPLDNLSTYSYGNYGNLISVNMANSAAFPQGITRSLTYHAIPSGALTSRTKSIGNSSAYAPDHWTGNYQFDLVGNVRRITTGTDNTYAGDDYTYEADYDSLHRLTRWMDSSLANPSNPRPTDTFFNYDASGNRTAWGNQYNGSLLVYKTPGGSTVLQNSTYDGANRLVSNKTTFQDAWFAYEPTSGPNVTNEPNGNPLSEYYQVPGSDPLWVTVTYEHNDANQLMRMITHVNNYWKTNDTFKYDGDGRRVWRDSQLAGSGGNTATGDVHEYVGSNFVKTAYGWYVLGMDSEPLYMLLLDVSDATMRAAVYAKDHLGSIRKVIQHNPPNSSPGVIIAGSYDYDAFGLPIQSYTTLSNRYNFASAPLDSVFLSSSEGYFGLYNLKARLYNPKTGRFLTQDSWKGDPWQPWTHNLYVYVGNNPVNYVDPTGHFRLALPSSQHIMMGAAAFLTVVSLQTAVATQAAWGELGDRFGDLVSTVVNAVTVHKPEYHAKTHGAEFGIGPNPNDPKDKSWVAKYVTAATTALQQAQQNGADYVIKFKHYGAEQIAYVKDGTMVIVNGAGDKIMSYFKPTETLYNFFNAANKSDVMTIRNGIEVPLSKLPGAP